MHLDDCYRVLDLDSRASTEEVRRAHRDLTKVWHPDRFGHDIALRRKAEENLKAINAAYDTIRASNPERDEDDKAPKAWRLPREKVKVLSRVSELLRNAGMLGLRPEGLWKRSG